VLIPIGLFLLAAIAATPLLRWGGPPAALPAKMLAVAIAIGGVVAAAAFVCGTRRTVALAVAALAGMTATSTVAAIWLGPPCATTNLRSVPGLPSSGTHVWLGPLWTLAANRRRYASFLLHLGVVCLAIGITGSSLGTRQREAVMTPGDTIQWADRSVHYLDLVQQDLPDKVVVAARLEISEGGAAPYMLLPAENLYRSQGQWSQQVAIHSTWSGDFYTILHGGKDHDRVSLTLIENPLMRWLWLAGWISVAGSLAALWPLRQRSERSTQVAVPAMHASLTTHKSAQTSP